MKTAMILDIGMLSAHYNNKEKLIGKIVKSEYISERRDGTFSIMNGTVEGEPIICCSMILCFKGNKKCKTCKHKLRCITS